MKKFFLNKIVIGLVATLVFYLSVPYLNNIEFIVESDILIPSSYPLIENFETYQDEKSNIKVKFNKDWKFYVAFENEKINDIVINKRVIFISENNAKIILDTWYNNNISLLDNYKNLQEVFTDNKVLVTDYNGKIFGKSAILSSNLNEEEGNLPHLSVIFQDKQNVYRINIPYQNEAQIQDYLKFLLTIEIEDETNSKYTDLEEFYLDNFRLPKKIEKLSLKNIISVKAVDTCGGYTMTGNNFPCCSSGGNCTWWAIYKRQDLKDKITWGNAGQAWITQANQANVPVYSSATPGAVVVWDGHVAYVEYLNGNGTFNISEMNCYPPAPAGPRNLDVENHYKDTYTLTLLGFIGNGSVADLTISNQTITSGNYSATNSIRILPDTILNPIYGEIRLFIN